MFTGSIFYDISGNFQWNAIVALISFVGAVFSLTGVILTVATNNRINKKNISLQKELAEKAQDISKKSEIRGSVTTYLTELTKIKQVLIRFVEARMSFEDSQKFLAQMMQQNINPDVGFGSNPRDNMNAKNEEMMECKKEWDESLKKAERQSQELLLYFRTNEEDSSFDELILSCPQKLKSINWIFKTNLPTKNLAPFLNGVELGQGIDDVRKEMRNYLNE